MRMRRGYTLLEMAVVLVILALTGAVAIPAFASLRPARGIDAAVTSLRVATQRASLRAVTTGATTELVVDAATARAWLHPQDSTFVLDLPVGCRLAGAARHVVRFSPDGRAVGALPEIACANEHARIVVDELTSAIEVSR